MYINTSHQQELGLGFGNYRCNWGVHFCGLYETEKERDEILMGFLHQGYLDGDLQFYCPAERTEANFRKEYQRSFKNSNCTELDDGNCFQFYSTRELYYPDGVFSPWAMDEGLGNFFQASQQYGPRNIRATAEMVWALESVPGIEHLMAYESRLNYFIPGKPWISICLYNVTRFDGATIMNVLKTHPFTISGGVITKNPYYQDPDVWLRENAPQFLNRLDVNE